MLSAALILSQRYSYPIVTIKFLNRLRPRKHESTMQVGFGSICTDEINQHSSLDKNKSDGNNNRQISDSSCRYSFSTSRQKALCRNLTWLAEEHFATHSAESTLLPVAAVCTKLPNVCKHWK